MAFFEQFTLVNTSANNGAFDTGATYVEDIGQLDGQSQIELMAQILLELKILNQQMYELPRLIATGTQAKDEPQTLRTEPSIFNI
jgi:hypothetical protein